MSTDSLILFLSKYSEENFQKSVQPDAPNNFVWKFLRFSEKIDGFKIFRFLLIELTPGRFVHSLNARQNGLGSGHFGLERKPNFLNQFSDHGFNIEDSATRFTFAFPFFSVGCKQIYATLG